MNKPEVLAPAGDMECLRAAVLYGADAVYLGGESFGMRAAPKNFTYGQLDEAVRYCHERDVKVYLTCNVIPTNEEADALPQHFRRARQAGVDALIVADVGVLRLAKEVAPDTDVHISTQAGVVNYLAANELHRLGASRVILAREMPLDDIARLREKTSPQLEVEVFVHGAMCMSFSGRCLLSNYLTYRDGNRGQCSQPCRWGYHLMEEKRPGQFFPIFEDQEGSYILNARDLCLLPYLDKLAQAGVASFKIEGRAKSVYYVAAVTGTYRQAVDLYCKDPENYDPPQWMMEEIRKVSHRQYSAGFLLPGQVPEQNYENRGYVREWEVVATVDGWRDGRLYCTERNRFSQGEELEILRPDGQPTPLVVNGMEDEEGQALETARHPMMTVIIDSPGPVPQGSMLRRKTGKMGPPKK